MSSRLHSIALFVLRVGLGGLMLGGHGLQKLLNFGTYATQFPDPLGLGKTTSLSLAIFAEFFCSILVILGIGTRLASIPIIITMLVAAVVAHASDPWVKKELAVVYLVGFITILIGGSGAFALGPWLAWWRKKRVKE